MQLYVFLYHTEVCAVQLPVHRKLFFKEVKTRKIQRFRQWFSGGASEELLGMGQDVVWKRSV